MFFNCRMPGRVTAKSFRKFINSYYYYFFENILWTYMPPLPPVSSWPSGWNINFDACEVNGSVLGQSAIYFLEAGL